MLSGECFEKGWSVSWVLVPCWGKMLDVACGQIYLGLMSCGVYRSAFSDVVNEWPCLMCMYACERG